MLNPDFKEFIELLNANRVRYLVVGFDPGMGAIKLVINRQ